MLIVPFRSGVLAALGVVVAACGGPSFTTADRTGDGGGSSGGGTTDGASAADGGVLGADGSSGPDPDGGRTDGGVGASEGGAMTGVDGASPPLAIHCGPVKSCASADTCCVSDVSGVFVYDCRAQCPNPVTGTVSELKCANTADCDSGRVCCVSRARGTTTSACTLACGGNDGQLCAPNAKATECSASTPCSSNNIGDWNLSTYFGTCGGISVP